MTFVWPTQPIWGDEYRDMVKQDMQGTKEDRYLVGGVEPLYQFWRGSL